MKRSINNQIKLIKISIDWWKEDSFKTMMEVEYWGDLYESGQVTEGDLLEKMEELGNRINYLERKSVFEQRNLFEAVAEK
jgi:hypothetical protein